MSEHRRNGNPSLGNDNLTPPQIVAELDRYIVAQADAKRAVAIALRNRWRRLHVPDAMRDEISPKNIIMIGPTGVGKTEISRRLARLAKAPFVKVEASKFTEVGYVGRDVDSIIRDLVDSAYHMVQEEERGRVLAEAEARAEEKLLDALLPGSRSREEEMPLDGTVILQDESGIGQTVETRELKSSSREKLRDLLRAGRLEDRVVEIEITKQFSTHMHVLGPQGLGEVEGRLKDMFAGLIPKQRETKELPVSEARKILISEAQDTLINPDRIATEALRRAEQTGIVFIDEIDKIAGKSNTQSPDISREGVQRDLLPLVEGSTISTKYGPVKTDHVLFIASGAFHVSKPSDLMPEFQGRFPIRVELKPLTADDFVRILTEPENAITRQYRELLATENVQLEFTEDGITEIARLTAEVNSRTENIGARRLHTLLEKLLEELSFHAHEYAEQTITVNREYVREKLASIVKDTDLSRFIL